MRKLLLLISLSLIVGCGGFAPSGQNTASGSLSPSGTPKERIAVIDLKNKAGVNEGELNYLSSLLRQAAGRLPQSKYSVMTQDNILVLLPPDTKLEDCVGTCAVDTGRRLGAHYVMVGEVVRFGSSLRVSLNLHHSQSGELRGSDTVKGDTVEALEGPLQGSAVGLFSVLDPSLKRAAERLKRGFVFEKFKYSDLPELPKVSEEPKASEPTIVSELPKVSEVPSEKKQTREVKITLPSSVSATVVKGVDFGSVDVEGLALYDETLKLDNDKEASAEAKLEKWELVAQRVPAVSAQAKARAEVWRKFIAERDRRIELARQQAERRAELARQQAERRAELARQQAELARQQAEKERLAKRAFLQKLQALKAEDEALESRRQAQMQKDWTKLSKLLSLSVVSAEDKQNWVEAFVEAYGAVSGLNPHIRALSKWTDTMPNFDDLEDEGEREVKRRARRNQEIAEKIDAILFVKDPKSGVKFIEIPAGSFPMGSNRQSDEKPIHTVTVKAFLMSESEVTVAQYRTCVEDGPCTEPSTSSGCTWDKSGKDNHPINCVDWGQARTFAVWAGGDLPTEAQWEYAARGGEDYTYAGSNNAKEVAWYDDNSGSSTHSVKTKKPNGYGLYDMSGNVWEWTLDEWHGNYRGAPGRAEKPWGSVGKCRQKCDTGSSRRVDRGGGWRGDARSARVANRDYDEPDNRYDDLGFRIRRTLP